MEQMSLFDLAPEQMEAAQDGKLKIVKAQFVEVVDEDWSELFEGFDELYGINSFFYFLNNLLCVPVLISDKTSTLSVIL